MGWHTRLGRRRRMFIAASLLLNFALLAVIAGFVYLQSRGGSPSVWTPFGESPSDLTSRELRQRRQEVAAKLAALGYVGDDAEGDGPKGLRRYDAALSESGFNLLLPRGGVLAVLTDMEGRELHSWSVSDKTLRATFPDRETQDEDKPYISRAKPFPNGDLLALIEKDAGLIRLDARSNVLWSHRNGHHDFFDNPDGTTYLLEREWNATRNIINDLICLLAPNGRTMKTVSLLRCVERSHYAPLLLASTVRDSDEPLDLFHTNAIEVIDDALADRHPAFQPGRLLISCRNLDLVGVVDPEQERLVWAAIGLWRRQHCPTLLPTGKILVFDNMGSTLGSRALEFDPVTQEIGWQFASSRRFPFYSDGCGTAARLPDGNTLITESAAGRAFEVTREGEVVWEYVNPMGTSLEEVVRLPPSFPVRWANGMPAPGSPFTGE